MFQNFPPDQHTKTTPSGICELLLALLLSAITNIIWLHCSYVCKPCALKFFASHFIYLNGLQTCICPQTMGGEILNNDVMGSLQKEYFSTGEKKKPKDPFIAFLLFLSLASW